MSKDIYFDKGSMKPIKWNKQKAKDILENTTRNINFAIIAEKIKKGEILKKYSVPHRPNQVRYIVEYNGYPCTVPTIEDEEKIFIKSARLDRKEKHLLSNQKPND